VPPPERYSDGGAATSRMHWAAGVQAGTPAAGCANSCPAGTAAGTTWLWRAWLPGKLSVAFRSWDVAAFAAPSGTIGGGGCSAAQLGKDSKAGMVAADCSTRLARWVRASTKGLLDLCFKWFNDEQTTKGGMDW
jgi:hypothetical protein